MLTIRFNRIGKKNKAYFRLVVQERTIAPGGGHVEILGSYDPHLKKESLKSERIKYWAEKGVNFSDTAFNFLVSKCLIAGPKRAVKMPKKTEAPVAEEKTSEIKTEEKKEIPKEEAKKKEIESEVIENKPEVKEEIKAEKKDKSEVDVDKK